MICAIALALGAQLNSLAQKEPRFPNLSGENLEGRVFNVPKDLQGDLNLAIVAFDRSQQAEIDTWAPSAQALRAANPFVQWYEIPVIQKTNRQAEKFINRGMHDGIQSKEARERTITLYTDKSEFEKKATIQNPEVIHLFLLNRKGEIVWRQEGPKSNDKLVSLTKAVQTWAAVHAPKFEALNSKPASLSDFRGKTVFLVISAKSPARSAGDLAQEVVLGTTNFKNVACVVVADLKGAPGVLRGMIRDGIKSTAKKDNLRLRKSMKEKGIEYEPRLEPITLLDWRGAVAKTYSVEGKTESAYQTFVLSPEGKIVYQGVQDRTETSPASLAKLIISAMRSTLSN